MGACSQYVGCVRKYANAGYEIAAVLPCELSLLHLALDSSPGPFCANYRRWPGTRLIRLVAAWVVRSKAATVRYFWKTHSCLI